MKAAKSTIIERNSLVQFATNVAIINQETSFL